MAVMEEHQFLYELFDVFIDEFIINENSLFDDTKNIFNKSNIDTCIKKFIDNFEESDRNYQEKIEDQFKGTSPEVKMLFAHANWLWSFSASDMTRNGKITSVEICIPDIDFEESLGHRDLFPEDGFGHAGSYHKRNKYWEIVSLLRIFRIIDEEKLKDRDKIKNRIEEISLFAKYDDTDDPKEEWQKSIRKIEKSCAMFNILPYLCYPENYERIASNGHKHKIIETFGSLLAGDEFEDSDKNIYAIRDQINKFIPGFDFYYKEILPLWNPKNSESEYNEIQGLNFKKNIILYGPPGTSKTYEADNIAKSFIYKKIIENDKSKIKEFIENKIDIDNRIRRLQLHSNYSYEDFIIGIHLLNGETKPKEGYLLELCKEISADDNDSPYVLILDEINRVDLSRLFGEAFSAIENREKEIDLSIKGFNIKVPDNLYIIGTMNEIDFSLERLDFALRRRFVWYFYEFDSDCLRSIIDKKREEYGLKKISEDDIEQFIENADSLNEKIIEIDDLGEQYQIGHTFFAEIIDIASGFVGRPSYVNKLPLFKDGGPVETLWDISIEPILEAFFGNLDNEQRIKHIEEIKEIMLNGKG